VSASRAFPARLIQFAFLAAATAAWFALSRSGAISPLFLPAPDAVWAALGGLIVTNTFWSAIGITLGTIARAYLIACAAGILTGYLVTRSRFLTAVLEPVISGLFAIPITLFFPLFILAFGIGPASKTAYGALYGFFPIALNTIAGLAHVDGKFLNAARSMGFSHAGTFRHVLFPAAFPVVLTGLRIGFFICFASVLGGEAISSVSGVGHNIALAAELMEPARMYAWIVFVVAAALALNMLVAAIESRMRGSWS
jgi:ABC-type nitrate/sulfonate/bicarbonate transport system permease component